MKNIFNSIKNVLFDFFRWLLNYSYISTPSFIFLSSCISLFLFLDSYNVIFLIIICFGFLWLILTRKINIIQKIVFKLFFLFVFVYYISIYVYPTDINIIQKLLDYKSNNHVTTICGFVKEISNNDVYLFNVKIDDYKYIPKIIVVRNLNTAEVDLNHIKVFDLVCFKISKSQYIKVKQSSTFVFSFYVNNIYLYHQTNIVADNITKLRIYIDYIFSKLFKDNSDVAKAMVFGIKNDIDFDHKNLFDKLGLSHVLVASGANILIIIYFLEFLKKLFIKLFKFDLLFINNFYFIVVLVYLFVVGIEGSLVRAIFFWLFNHLEDLLGNEISDLNKILLVSLFILLFFPYLFFSLNYIFSISAIIGLSLGNKCIRLINYSSKFNLVNLFVSSFCVVFTTNLVSYYFFNSLNFNGLVANILFLPLLEFFVFFCFLVFFIISFIHILNIGFLTNLIYLLLVTPLSYYLQFLLNLMKELEYWLNSFLIFKNLASNNLFLFFGLIFFIISFYFLSEFVLFKRTINISN